MKNPTVAPAKAEATNPVVDNAQPKDTQLPTASTTTTSTDSPIAAPPIMSKTQLKKLQKKERTRQKQQDKKRREKEERRAKAIAAGRDLEAERAFQQERTLAGDRQRRLQDMWAAKIQDAQHHQFQICIDCAFEDDMREREIASLAQQIRYCYAYNRKSPHPSLVAVTSLGNDSATLALLEKETGFATWHQRAFTCTQQSLQEYYYGVENLGNDGAKSTRKPPKLVYLTSDSTTVLQHLEDDAIYIIGGIVDRNRLKGVAMNRATKLGIPTAKLPLDEYLAQMPSTRVLTCNHVFDILLKHRENGNDWSLALQQVLPSRKGAELKDKLATEKV